MIRRKFDSEKHNYSDPRHPRYANFDKTHPHHLCPSSIKVVSYNIKYSKKVDKAIHIFKSNHTLTEADIVCLQEMDPHGVELFANQLHYNYIYYPAVLHPHHGKDFGNAILSKWPIIEDKKFIFPNPIKKPSHRQRIAVNATIQIDQLKIMIFSIHMGVIAKANQRAFQIEKLIETIPDDISHCIIGGDFNTFTKKNSKAIFNIFVAYGYQLATERVGWTFKHWYLFNKKSLLDHIFTKGLWITDTGKIDDHSASDHLPIWVELSFNKK